MTFTESNTVEQMILDVAVKFGGKQAAMVREDALPYGGESLGAELRPARWTYASHDPVPHQLTCPRIEHGRFSSRDRACFTTE
jgi:hypothetical protein